MFGKLHMLAAAVAMTAVPIFAKADHRFDYRDHDRDRGEVHVDLNFGGHSEPRTVVQRDWVEPVYQTVQDRVWVPAEYRTVVDHVWREPVTQCVTQRVWVPDRFEVRDVVVREHHHDVIRHQNVLVEPGHYADVKQDVVVTPGHYEDVPRQELVCDAHWQVVEKQQLVAPGHWEDRPVAVAPRHEEVGGRIALKFPL